MGKSRWHQLSALMAALCIMVGAQTAAAGEPTDTPWSKGVKAEDRDAGQRLFVEGNTLFGAEKYSAALRKYTEAIKRYDHPSIRFNLAVTLIRMRRPVEAYHHLLKAMRFGPAPFERPELFKEARTYKQLLEDQLTRLEVTCSLRGAKVSLDGEPLLTCPGKTSRTLEPGTHQLVGVKKGYLTRPREVVLMPGKRQVESVVLISIDSATVTRRRWALWKPWAATGIGAAIALTGIPLLSRAADNRDRWDALVASMCADGCAVGAYPDDSDLDRSKLQNALAVSAFVIGGAIVVSGVTLALLNRPRAVQRDDIKTPARTSRVRITPTVAPGLAGIALHKRF